MTSTDPERPRRGVLGRYALIALAAGAAVGLSGCMALVPSKTDEAAQQQITQTHAAQVTVTAPFGSTIQYGWGTTAQTAQVDNTGHWSAEIDAQGITNVFVTITPNTLGNSDATASCDITIGSTDLAKNATVPGVGGPIECSASTAAT